MVNSLDAVTGVGGFTGRVIARRLLEAGRDVLNITNHPEKASNLGPRIRSIPFDFDHPDRLAQNLTGVCTLYNTYWIRFERGEMTFEKAVQNSKTLIEAAKTAGVKRIVHISVLNPSKESPFPYYRAKAEVEEFIKASGVSYAILRPAMIFGEGGVLINNLAYFLRRLPVFAIPGSGEYKVQPVYVEDLADLAIRLAVEDSDVITDATGPEIYTFNELVAMIKKAVGSRAIIVHSPIMLSLLVTTAMGIFLGDIIFTLDELRALNSNQLVSSSPPTCQTALSEWVSSNADRLGVTYLRDVRK